MEMQNSAVTQLMATQTSILEEIKRLREKDELRQRFSDIVQTPSAAPASPSGLSTSDIDMFEGGNHYPEMATPPLPGPYSGEQYYDTLSVDPYNSSNTMPGGMPSGRGYDAQPQNPSKYASVAALPVAGGVVGATGQAAESMLSYDPSRMSKEATAEYFAQRSRGVQTGAVDAAGSALQVGGFLGSLAIGGLLPSLAVGGAVAGSAALVAGSMTKGAEDALNYQDILRRDGYKAFNAFESTTDYGGIGMNLDDQQEMSGFLRDLSDDNFLENDEMANILQGALDNKLLKSTSDMKSFKEKFSKIVEGVKEISLTLDQTLDEAVEFMGEMERRGVMTDKMSNISAQLKVGSSMQGMDATEFANQVLGQTDAIVGGTSMNAENVIEDLSFANFVVAGIEEESEAGDGVLKQYIKNSGGGTAVAGQLVASARGYVEGDVGSKRLLSIAASAFEQNEEGAFTLNQGKFDELVNSDKSYFELERESTAHLMEMDVTDKARLVETAGAVFNQTADQDELLQLFARQQEAYMHETGVEVDASTALRNMGVVSGYEDADILSDLIEKGTNDDINNQFDSRARKEEMDSAEKSRNPGFFNKIKYDFKKAVTNPIGDVGQWASDSVGSISEDLQMMAAGIEEDGAVGGALLQEHSAEKLEEMYVGEDSQHAKMMRNIAEMQINGTTGSDASDKAAVDFMVEESIIKEVKTFESEISTGEFERMIDDLDSGKMSGEELMRLRASADTGDMEKDTQQRADYVLNKASGDYEGASNKIQQMKDYNVASYASNSGTIPGISSGSPSADKRLDLPNTLEQIEDLEDALKDDMSAAQKELQKIAASGDSDIGLDQMAEFEAAIRSGDVDAVSKMTGNADSKELATTFQELLGRSNDLGGVKSEFLDFNRHAAASKEYAGDMLNFLETTGAFENGEVQDLYGAYEKSADDLLGNMSKMEQEEIYSAQAKLHQQGEDIFNYMDKEDLYTVAEDLAGKNSSIKMEDLMMDDYANVVDPAKVYDTFMNDVMRQQQTTGSQASDVEGTGDVSEVASDHKKANEELVNALASETKMVRELVADMGDGAIKNNYTYTGNSGI